MNSRITKWWQSFKNRRSLGWLASGLVGLVMVSLGIGMLLKRTQDIGTAQAAAQVEELAQNIRRLYQNRPDYWGLNTAYLIEKKAVPETMVNGSVLKSVWGTPVLVGNGANGDMLMPGSRSFDIIIKDLNKQECVELASFKFNDKFWLGVFNVTVSNGSDSKVFSWNNEGNGLPVKLGDVKSLCKERNEIIWHYE